MITLALTGGIATGKSSFARHFLELAPGTRLFDCDACVHELLQQPDIIRCVEELLGPVLAADGSLDRAKLRAVVFEHPERRRTLEGILHPLVRSACGETQSAAAAAGLEFFIADVPLLYESGFPMARDLDVVVACTPAVQRARLMERSRLSGEMTDRIIAAQLPITEKMRRASVVIWNGGTPDSLRRQAACLLAALRHPGGASQN